MRMLHGSIADWPAMLLKIKRYLKPGGKVELLEMALGEVLCDDGSVTPDQAYPRWARLLTEASEKRGRIIHLGPRLKGLLTDAGFLDVHERINKCPQSPYGDDEFLLTVGRIHQMNVLGGLDGWTTRAFTGVLGWPLEDVQAFLKQVKAEVMDPDIHQYLNQHVVYGTKEGVLPPRENKSKAKAAGLPIGGFGLVSLTAGAAIVASALYYSLRRR